MTDLLVCYDVPDDKRRTKLAKRLEQLGRRVQYSVFVLRNRSVQDVVDAVEPIIVASEDNVRVHALCVGCLKRTATLGLAKDTSKPDTYRIF